MAKSEGQKKSQKHEQRLSKKYADGTVNAGSGSFWSRKNDVRTARYLIEHKYTGAKLSLSIKASWLRDVWVNAIKEGKMPVLAFHLDGKDYVILSEDDFDELTELAFGDE